MIWPFKRKLKVVDASHMVKFLPPVREPTKGEKWVFKKGGDPWMRMDYPSIILDVMEGWVRYNACKIAPDERMRTEIFIKIYELQDKE